VTLKRLCAAVPWHVSMYAPEQLGCCSAQGFGMIDDVALAGSKVALTVLGYVP
jgi:hypothetical protein